VLAGKRLGFKLDAIRALTSAGSLRAVSYREASKLLDSLNRQWSEGAPLPRRPKPKGGPEADPRCGNGRRAPAGVLKMITPRQKEVIHSYQRRLEWNEDRLDEFLKRTFSLTFAELASRRDASRILTVLRKLVDHKNAKDEKAEVEAAACEGALA